MKSKLNFISEMYDFFQNTNRMVIKIGQSFPKIGRRVSGNFRSSELQNFPGEDAPGQI